LALIQQRLQQLTAATGQQLALVYIFIREDQLDVILVPADAPPIYRPVPEAGRKNLLPVVQEFLDKITAPRERKELAICPPPSNFTNGLSSRSKLT
jgi:CHAT domain-containing protein